MCNISLHVYQIPSEAPLPFDMEYFGQLIIAAGSVTIHYATIDLK